MLIWTVSKPNELVILFPASPSNILDILSINASTFVQSSKLLKEHGKSKTLLNTQSSSVTHNLNWSQFLNKQCDWGEETLQKKKQNQNQTPHTYTKQPPQKEALWVDMKIKCKTSFCRISNKNCLKQGIVRLWLISYWKGVVKGLHARQQKVIA